MPTRNPKKRLEVSYFWITLYYPDEDSIDETDIVKLREELKKIDKPREKVHSFVLLHSIGGDAGVAYKMVNMIRSKCESVAMLIPHYAKSAATLIALGGDSITMGQESELGPLDLPIEHPLMEGIRLSALDGVNCLEYLASTAAEMIFKLGLRIRTEVQLGRKDSLEIASRFSGAFIEPIVSQLEPLVVHLCYRSLHIAEGYGEDILVRNMFRQDKDGKEKAKTIIHSLVWNYPYHGYAISRDEAKKLGLRIIEAESFKPWDQLWQNYMKLRDRGEKVISVSAFQNFPRKKA